MFIQCSPLPQVFISPAPLAAPQQPAAALARWLRLLAFTDWRQQPLLVSLNGELAAEQQAPLLARFRTEREKLPALVAFTPNDETGTAWTHERPTAVVLQHVQVRRRGGDTGGGRGRGAGFGATMPAFR